jgi:hypothetical protein
MRKEPIMASSKQKEFLETQDPETLPSPENLPQIKLYSHSRLFYWWPAWVAGYVMALITWLGGYEATIFLGDEYGEVRVWMYPNTALGVTFVLILLAVTLFTCVSFRGWASVGLIGLVLFVAMFLAWMDWWDEVVALIPQIRIFVNLGFYLVFSTALFLLWAVVFFITDRLHFYRIKPGLMTHEHVVGEASKNYDTTGLLMEKYHEDLFRHWLLGLGSGDLRIYTSGARQETLELRNVLFVDWKVEKIKRLIAVKPDDLLKEQED